MCSGQSIAAVVAIMNATQTPVRMRAERLIKNICAARISVIMDDQWNIALLTQPKSLRHLERVHSVYHSYEVRWGEQALHHENRLGFKPKQKTPSSTVVATQYSIVIQYTLSDFDIAMSTSQHPMVPVTHLTKAD